MAPSTCSCSAFSAASAVTKSWWHPSLQPSLATGKLAPTVTFRLLPCLQCVVICSSTRRVIFVPLSLFLFFCCPGWHQASLVAPSDRHCPFSSCRLAWASTAACACLQASARPISVFGRGRKLMHDVFSLSSLCTITMQKTPVAGCLPLHPTGQDHR